MIVACRGKHFDHAGRDIQNGHVERTAAQIVNHDLLRLLFINAVGKGGCRRLVDDALDVEARNLARVLRRLTLCVGKIGRDSDDGVGHRFAEEGLGIRFEFLQDHRGNFLRRVFMPVDGNLVVGTHLALNGRNGAVMVCDSLPLCNLADHAFSGLGKRNDRRRCASAFGVGDDNGFAALHHRHAAVGCAEINTDCSGHTEFLL